MIAQVEAGDAVYVLDLEDETIVAREAGAVLDPGPVPPLSLPRLLGAAVSGSTVVALVDAKPPLLVSHDAGRTWRDAGRGLPTGYAVAISGSNPDAILYAGRNRLWLSRDGGRFWSSLALDLPEIRAVALD